MGWAPPAPPPAICISQLPPAPPQRTPPATMRKIRAGYAGGITWTDLQIGKVLDELDATGAREETLVLYWADHGGARHGRCRHSIRHSIRGAEDAILFSSREVADGIARQG